MNSGIITVDVFNDVFDKLFQISCVDRKIWNLFSFLIFEQTRKDGGNPDCAEMERR